MNYRRSIFYNYEGFFGKPSKNKEQTSRQPTTDEIDKKWMWLLMVDRLVKELNMTPQQVFDMNYLSALNWLSLYTIKDNLKKKDGNS